MLAMAGTPRPDAMTWRALPRVALLVGLCLCQFIAGSAGTANVTLSTITLHKKFSWFTTPKIYFSCKRSNETLVMKAPVQSLDMTYNMTGSEDWQPVTRLDPRECQECELFESTWMGKGHLTHWNVCTDNFTEANHATFVHKEPGYVELNLSCPLCAQAAYHTQLAHDGSGELTFSGEVAPFFWVAIGVASLGAILIIVGSLAYLRYEEYGDEAEKQKFIEMTEEDAALHDRDDLEDDFGLAPERRHARRRSHEGHHDDDEAAKLTLEHVPLEKPDDRV